MLWQDHIFGLGQFLVGLGGASRFYDLDWVALPPRFHQRPSHAENSLQSKHQKDKGKKKKKKKNLRLLLDD